jgi:putative DNA primase/helicase
MKSPERVAQRKSPHITAENFKAEQRPTLINYEEEFLAYDDEGAYRLVKNDTIKNEVQRYLEGAQEMRPSATARGAMKAYPFNPKDADIKEVSNALYRQNHVAPGSISPPFFLPGPIDYSAIDPRNVISCRNGLLDIGTRLRYEPSPQFFTRSALPIEYDPDARPVRWLTFLDEVLAGDAELILLIQQMFGYLITSETRHQKIFYLRGISNSGKSTMMRVLDALIGERNICNPTIADLADKNTLNDMTASTLAKITDMNTDNAAHLSEAASNLNRISGEDPVHVFRKFKSGINVKMRVRFLMAGNQFPNFKEHATALARRLLVVPFSVSFEQNADPDLSAKLIAELPGILNWALDGLDALRTAGRFIEPAASKRAKQEILNSGDPIRSFVTDECELGPEFSCLKDDLFARYRLHCQTIGVSHALAKPKFIASLKTAYNGLAIARPTNDDGEREHVMRGIRLNDVERVPTTITKVYRLDPELVDMLGGVCDAAIMRDAGGKLIEYDPAADEFDEA